MKWDPRPVDSVFLFQSGILHTQYYQVSVSTHADDHCAEYALNNFPSLKLQIIIHRAYIPTPRKPPQTTFPSLAICMNAARICCQIVSYCRRNVSFFGGNCNVFQVSLPHSAAVECLLTVAPFKLHTYSRLPFNPRW